MIFNVVILNLIWSFVLDEISVACGQQDQTSARANTLLDDADDLQKQLDNEARDRIKFSGNTIRHGATPNKSDMRLVKVMASYVLAARSRRHRNCSCRRVD
ncbi:hypothetical protein evm_003272 [Chilo suppressalis]|nr:hypothetical protein evm_003272 [Chilo suppressalis]